MAPRGRMAPRERMDDRTVPASPMDSDITEIEGIVDFERRVEEQSSDFTPVAPVTEAMPSVEEPPEEEQLPREAGGSAGAREGKDELSLKELEEIIDMSNLPEFDEQAAVSKGKTSGGEARMAEINVLIAYEQYNRAAEFVREALKEEPENVSYHLKLLEIYKAMNDQKKFEEAARIFHDKVGGQGEAWQSVQEMWSGISPDRELFKESEQAVMAATQRLSEEASHKLLEQGATQAEDPADGQADGKYGLEFETGDKQTKQEEPKLQTLVLGDLDTDSSEISDDELKTALNVFKSDDVDVSEGEGDVVEATGDTVQVEYDVSEDEAGEEGVLEAGEEELPDESEIDEIQEKLILTLGGGDLEPELLEVRKSHEAGELPHDDVELKPEAVSLKSVTEEQVDSGTEELPRESAAGTEAVPPVLEPAGDTNSKAERLLSREEVTEEISQGGGAAAEMEPEAAFLEIPGEDVEQPSVTAEGAVPSGTMPLDSETADVASRRPLLSREEAAGEPLSNLDAAVVSDQELEGTISELMSEAGMSALDQVAAGTKEKVDLESLDRAVMAAAESKTTDLQGQETADAEKQPGVPEENWLHLDSVVEQEETTGAGRAAPPAEESAHLRSLQTGEATPASESIEVTTEELEYTISSLTIDEKDSGTSPGSSPGDVTEDIQSRKSPSVLELTDREEGDVTAASLLSQMEEISVDETHSIVEADAEEEKSARLHISEGETEVDMDLSEDDSNDSMEAVSSQLIEDLGGKSSITSSILGGISHELDEEEKGTEEEMDIQLDLARAYAELGDRGNARNSIEAIMAGGDEEQKFNAKELLKSLGEE